MKTPILIIALIVSAFNSVIADAGSDLLDQVQSKYSTCRSFYCEGHLSTVLLNDGEKAPHMMEKKFTVRFQRPSLLRVDWFEPNSSSFTSTACSLYVENGKYYGISSFQRTPEEFKTLQDGIGTYAGISGGTTRFIPALLLGQKGRFYASTAKILEGTNINNHVCHTLEVLKNSQKWTLFIDKSNYAIVRSIEFQKVDGAELQKSVAEALKEEKDKEGIPATSVKDFTLETTTDFSAISFDTEMKTEDFVFKENK